MRETKLFYEADIVDTLRKYEKEISIEFFRKRLKQHPFWPLMPTKHLFRISQEIRLFSAFIILTELTKSHARLIFTLIIRQRVQTHSTYWVILRQQHVKPDDGLLECE